MHTSYEFFVENCTNLHEDKKKSLFFRILSFCIKKWATWTKVMLKQVVIN